jgi:hypothetical protein
MTRRSCDHTDLDAVARGSRPAIAHETGAVKMSGASTPPESAGQRRPAGAFAEAVELPAVEQLVTQPAVEALDPRVLPWRAGVDEHTVGAGEAASVRDCVGDELGTVVEPDAHRRPTACEGEAVEHGHDAVGVDGVIDPDRQCL